MGGSQRGNLTEREGCDEPGCEEGGARGMAVKISFILREELRADEPSKEATRTSNLKLGHVGRDGRAEHQ